MIGEFTSGIKPGKKVNGAIVGKVKKKNFFKAMLE
jgi:hypothetical protein